MSFKIVLSTKAKNPCYAEANWQAPPPFNVNQLYATCQTLWCCLPPPLDPFSIFLRTSSWMCGLPQRQGIVCDSCRRRKYPPWRCLCLPKQSRRAFQVVFFTGSSLNGGCPIVRTTLKEWAGKRYLSLHQLRVPDHFAVDCWLQRTWQR